MPWHRACDHLSALEGATKRARTIILGSAPLVLLSCSAIAQVDGRRVLISGTVLVWFRPYVYRLRSARITGDELILEQLELEVL